MNDLLGLCSLGAVAIFLPGYLMEGHPELYGGVSIGSAPVLGHNAI